MWWKIVSDNMEMNVTNCSWSGSTVTGAPKGNTSKAACSDKRVQDAGRNGTPDIIFCYIGINDWFRGVSIGDWSAGDPIIDDSGYSESDTITSFSDAYALMLYKLKSTYTTSTIYCMTCMDDTRRDVIPGKPSDNKNGVTVAEWNDKIKEIATAMNCGIIDMHECGVNYDTASSYLQDGLHPNAAGMSLMANYVINAL